MFNFQLNLSMLRYTYFVKRYWVSIILPITFISAVHSWSPNEHVYSPSSWTDMLRITSLRVWPSFSKNTLSFWPSASISPSCNVDFERQTKRTIKYNKYLVEKQACFHHTLCHVTLTVSEETSTSKIAHSFSFTSTSSSFLTNSAFTSWTTTVPEVIWSFTIQVYSPESKTLDFLMIKRCTRPSWCNSLWSIPVSSLPFSCHLVDTVCDVSHSKCIDSFSSTSRSFSGRVNFLRKH